MKLVSEPLSECSFLVKDAETGKVLAYYTKVLEITAFANRVGASDLTDEEHSAIEAFVKGKGIDSALRNGNLMWVETIKTKRGQIRSIKVYLGPKCIATVKRRRNGIFRVDIYKEFERFLDDVNMKLLEIERCKECRFTLCKNL